MSENNDSSTVAGWLDVLYGGISSALDGVIAKEFAQPQTLAPMPAESVPVPPPISVGSGFQINQQTMLIAGGVLVVAVIAATVLK